MDPKEFAEDLLAPIFTPGNTKTESALMAIAYGLIAVCERMDELSFVAIPQCEELEELE